MQPRYITQLVGKAFKQINLTLIFLLLVTMVISGIVGGLGLTLLLSSVLISASIISLKTEFLITRSSLILSYLVHIIWLAVYFTFGIGFAREYLGILFQDHLKTTLFHPLKYSHQGPEFGRVGSLFILAAPSLFFCAKSMYLLRKKVNYPGKRIWGDGTFAAYATLIPYVYIAIIKLQNPWKALSFIMSGDGRNHFEFVEQIRTTSRTTLSLKAVGVPVLGNALGSLISAANGAHGYLDIRDIWGIQSVYIFSAGILTAIAAVFLTTYFKGNGFSSYALLVVPMLMFSILVTNTGYIAFPILFDGFLSLYFGIAVLALVICYFFLTIDQKNWSVALTIIFATWGVACAYTYLAPASLLLAIMFLYSTWHQITIKKWKILSGIFVLVVGPIALLMVGRHFVAEFELRGQMPGSVWPTNGVMLFIFFLVVVLLISTCVGALRKFFIGLGLIVATTAIMLVYIELLPANRGVSYSYYSSKLIIGTVGSLLVIVPLLVSLFFKTTAWQLLANSKNRSRRMLAVISISVLPLGMIHPLNVHHPIVEIQRGWVNPDAKSIRTVIGHWKKGPKLYFQFAKNDDLYGYPSASADRILNFWSPLFWDASGEYSNFYTWAYLGQSSSDPAILCEIIKSKQITIVTRNPELPAQVAISCGPTETKFEIRG